MVCSCASFSLIGESETVYLSKPYWDNVTNSISNHIDIYDFWNEDRSTVNEGINTQPLRMKGVEVMACNHNSGFGFPICFPLCFKGCMSIKFDLINDMIDDHEEVTINDLGDCLNGVYIIKRFSFRYIPNTNYAYEWDLILERVRDL